MKLHFRLDSSVFGELKIRLLLGFSTLAVQVMLDAILDVRHDKYLYIHRAIMRDVNIPFSKVFLHKVSRHFLRPAKRLRVRLLVHTLPFSPYLPLKLVYACHSKFNFNAINFVAKDRIRSTKIKICTYS